MWKGGGYLNCIFGSEGEEKEGERRREEGKEEGE